MELLLLYIWLKLDYIHGTTVIASASCAIIAIIWYICSAESYESETKKARYRVLWRRFAVAALCFFSLALLLPTSKQAAVVIGAHYAFKIAESPEVQKIVVLARLKANEMLDEAISAETKKVEKK